VLEMPIGETDPLFLDSQEDFFHGCSESTHEESSEDSREENYIDEDNDYPLEEMFLPPEMLHSVQSLRPPKCRQHRVGLGHGVRQDVGKSIGGIDIQA
jgi:hypothetical protein